MGKTMDDPPHPGLLPQGGRRDVARPFIFSRSTCGTARKQLGKRFYREQRTGVTLIELLVTMALVATLAGLATVAFVRSFQARSLDGFVKDLTAYLRYLQFDAIESGAAHKLVLNPESGRLETFVRNENSTQFEPFRSPYSQRFQEAKVFSIDFSRGDEIYFFPDGAVTRNQLFVSRNGTRQATVEIKNRIGAFGVTTHG
ncbi:MAG: hypothetical protein A3G87_04315 [Omnitrophica bacterium RIFCSPLOWO2_12_FULL_50_11]|nr:MAG: hypothetical protein A3G87_04315 [Omnitrophica bacterium RIFCSPLOWO2_12_FULL_50_11]